MPRVCTLVLFITEFYNANTEARYCYLAALEEVMLWMWSCVYLEKESAGSADKCMRKAVKRRRALETVEDTLRTQAQNRTRMASMRASETNEQTSRRQEQDRICTASMINPRRACAGGLR